GRPADGQPESVSRYAPPGRQLPAGTTVTLLAGPSVRPGAPLAFGPPPWPPLPFPKAPRPPWSWTITVLPEVTAAAVAGVRVAYVVLAFGPPPPGKPWPLAPKPVRPVAVAAGAVARPTAKATPPTATTSATARIALTNIPLPPRRLTGAAGTGAEATEGTAVWSKGSGRGLGPTGAAQAAVASSGPGSGRSGSSERESMVMLVLLLVAQGADRIESRGHPGRPHAEHHPDGQAEQDGRRDRRRVELEAPTGELADQGGDGEAEHDPDQAAEQRQGQGLDEELGEDVATARADGLADADLAGPLPDRDQHDVHDPDAADDQRDRGDPAEQQRERPGDRVGRLEELRLVEDREVVRGGRGEVVAVAQKRLDRRLDVGHLV